MKRNDIIRIAQEAGLHIATDVKWMPIIGLEYAEKFAKLIAQHEREACAGIVVNEAMQYAEPVWAFEIVNDIKARGQA
jgi:hypothetical protein